MTSRQYKWALLVLAVASVVLLVLLAGCGGGSSSVPGTDWIVGTWELYALSDSLTGPKVDVTQFGMSATLIFYSDHTWWGSASIPGQPTTTHTGTWVKSGATEYISRESGAPDETIHRYGSSFYYADLVDGQLWWFWFRRQ